MKKSISIFLLTLSIFTQIAGCSKLNKTNSQKYNISNDFKNQSIELVNEIETSDILSNTLETNVYSFIEDIDGNSNYTKDEQNLAMSIFNYYGQLLFVSTAKAEMNLSGDSKNYNKQKSEADSIKKQIEQYLK